MILRYRLSDSVAFVSDIFITWKIFVPVFFALFFL